MPTYLCHGFRWHRRDIRVFVVLNDLDDAASNWVIGPATSSAILSQFHTSFDFLPEPPSPSAPPSPYVTKKPRPATASDGEPLHHDDDFTVPPSRVAEANDAVLVHSWSAVKLLEEFDPEDTRLPSRPYAYVADYVVRIDLSANVVDEMAKYRMRKQDEWFERLRDELQKGEDIRWYVVVCGDELREVPAESDDEANLKDDESEEESVVDDDDMSQGIPQGLKPRPSKPPPLKPPPLQPVQQQQRPRTSPGPSSTSSLPLRPSPLSSHPPLPTPPAEPGGQKQPARPPLKNKKSMAEGLRRLFGKKESATR